MNVRRGKVITSPPNRELISREREREIFHFEYTNRNTKLETGERRNFSLIVFLLSRYSLKKRNTFFLEKLLDNVSDDCKGRREEEPIIILEGDANSRAYQARIVSTGRYSRSIFKNRNEDERNNNNKNRRSSAYLSSGRKWRRRSRGSGKEKYARQIMKTGLESKLPLANELCLSEREIN